MSEYQKKYEQTPKGKQARKKAIATYKDKMQRWEALIPPELSDALEEHKPVGMSRSAYLKEILQKHLDNICMPNT